MTWWWESIHSARLYPHWAALSAFLAGTGIARSDLRPAQFGQIEGPVVPYGVAAPDEALVWLLDRGFDWPHGAAVEDPPSLAGVKLVLKGVTDGRWSAEWWDTLTGKQVTDAEVTATGGELKLEAPPFHADIAVRLKKR
jgi:hypothetical protein